MHFSPFNCTFLTYTSGCFYIITSSTSNFSVPLKRTTEGIAPLILLTFTSYTVQFKSGHNWGCLPFWNSIVCTWNFCCWTTDRQTGKIKKHHLSIGGHQKTIMFQICLYTLHLAGSSVPDYSWPDGWCCFVCSDWSSTVHHYTV